MRYTLVDYKESIYGNYWVVPTLMSFTALILAVVLLYVDSYILTGFFQTYFDSFISLENSKTTLGLIASAIVMIATITFSITILILSTTSNQLGPRLLPNFMKQGSTQLVSGFLVGSFIYCLVILHMTPMFNVETHFPYLSITVGLLLGVISFFVLIYFIHFISHTIQIDNVLTLLAEELTSTIERELPNIEKINSKPIQKIISSQEAVETNSKKHKTNIIADSCGYILTIDYDKLCTLAKKVSGIINVLYIPGQFVFKQLSLIEIYHDLPIEKNMKKACLATLTLGKHRTTNQDITFAFEQISQIAIKSLSSSNNNPYEAMHGFDRLIQGFAALSKKTMLPRVICDQEANVRLMRKVISYDDIVQSAINPFRQYAKNDLYVASYFFSIIHRLMLINVPIDLSDAILRQVKCFYNEINQSSKLNTIDQANIDVCYQKIISKEGCPDGNNSHHRS